MPPSVARHEALKRRRMAFGAVFGLLVVGSLWVNMRMLTGLHEDVTGAPLTTTSRADGQASTAVAVVDPDASLLTNLPRTRARQKSPLIIVTASDYLYFDRLPNLIGSIHRWMPHWRGDGVLSERRLDDVAPHAAADRSEATPPPPPPPPRIVVYDLGMSRDQREQVESWCDVEVRDPDFGTFNLHVWQLRLWAWKPLVLRDAIRQAADETSLASRSHQQPSSVLWLDAGLELRATPFELWDRLRERRHFFAQSEPDLRHFTPSDVDMALEQLGLMDDAAGIARRTASDADKTKKLRAFAPGELGGPMLNAAVLGFEALHTSPAVERILLPAAKCAARVECAAPPGLSLDNFRFDQSIMSLLIARANAATDPAQPLIHVSPESRYASCATVRACSQPQLRSSDPNLVPDEPNHDTVLLSRRWLTPKPYAPLVEQCRPAYTMWSRPSTLAWRRALEPLPRRSFDSLSLLVQALAPAARRSGTALEVGTRRVLATSGHAQRVPVVTLSPLDAVPSVPAAAVGHSLTWSSVWAWQRRREAELTEYSGGELWIRSTLFDRMAWVHVSAHLPADLALVVWSNESMPTQIMFEQEFTLRQLLREPDPRTGDTALLATASAVTRSVVVFGGLVRSYSAHTAHAAHLAEMCRQHFSRWKVDVRGELIDVGTSAQAAEMALVITLDR